MNPMKVLADQTADILRLFGDEITREEVAELLPKTPAMKVLRSRDAAGAGELAALVLAQFPRSEPPAERFVDYLPEFTADELAGIAADVEHPVVDLERYDFGYYNPTTGEGSAVIDGEVTSPYGPCNGLTADSRDNTCTNFAAEYVSYQSAEWAGMTCRRLCKLCADLAPDVYSRKPLTTTPGGYPVERAA